MACGCKSGGKKVVKALEVRRAKPLNGTVGVTKPKAQEIKAALEAGDTAKVAAFLNEAIAVCESNEYTVLTAESEE